MIVYVHMQLNTRSMAHNLGRLAQLFLGRFVSLSMHARNTARFGISFFLSF